MPANSPTPFRAMKIPRPTILLLMVIVAVVAIGLGAVKSRRDAAMRANLERLAADLRRAEGAVRGRLGARDRGTR